MAAMAEQPSPHERVRDLLNRRTAAADHQRTSLGRLLGLDPTETTAVLAIGRSGQLTPGELGRRLGMTSGGVTALVQRLERAGHVRRHPHPRDKRSALLSLQPSMIERATALLAPLVADLDVLVDQLDDGELAIVVRFLERAAEVSEQHAEGLAAQATAARSRPVAPPAPGLWA
jgi:DNA-binding MarR family transcriptional regulator